MEISTFTSKCNKEGSMLCVSNSKKEIKNIAFQRLEYHDSCYCITCFTITSNAFFPQSASTCFVEF
jgi:hypothetical protein